MPLICAVAADQPRGLSILTGTTPACSALCATGVATTVAVHARSVNRDAGTATNSVRRVRVDHGPRSGRRARTSAGDHRQVRESGIVITVSPSYRVTRSVWPAETTASGCRMRGGRPIWFLATTADQEPWFVVLAAGRLLGLERCGHWPTSRAARRGRLAGAGCRPPEPGVRMGLIVHHPNLHFIHLDVWHFLCGRAGRLTAQNAGFQPGQWACFRNRIYPRQL
jgi:hypothetical protein